MIAFYQRFKAERGSNDDSDWDAARFGMYLLENIEEVEELLALEVAYPPPEPPTDSK